MDGLDTREPGSGGVGSADMEPADDNVARLVRLDTFESELDMPLDPGIRRYVLILRSQGIETYESCQGGEGHSFPEPTVRFAGNSVEGYRAFAAAMNYGLPVFSLRRFYQVNDGQLEGPWWEMTFRTTDQGD